MYIGIIHKGDTITEEITAKSAIELCDKLHRIQQETPKLEMIELFWWELGMTEKWSLITAASTMEMNSRNAYLLRKKRDFEMEMNRRIAKELEGTHTITMGHKTRVVKEMN